MYQTEVMRVLNFTEADLDANRHGYLTKEQRIKLRKTRWGVRDSLLVLLPVAIPFLIIGILGVVARVQIGIRSLSQELPALIGIIVIMALFLIPTFIFLATGVVDSWRSVNADLRKGHVVGISGQLFLDVPDMEKGINIRRRLTYNPSYLININGLRFPMTRKQWLVLLDGEHYPHNVYYAPNSKTLLSIERLQ
jgi:hypothetical protein